MPRLTPLALGALALASFTTPRRTHAQAAPTPVRTAEAFDRLLKGVEATVSRVGPTTAPQPKADTLPGWVGLFRLAHRPARFWVFQQDTTLRRPMAGAGDSVLIVDTETRVAMPARVIVRRQLIGRSDPYMCGNPPDLTEGLQGWGYALDREPALVPDEDGAYEQFRYVVLPRTARVATDTVVPAGIQRAMRDSLTAAARRSLAQMQRESPDFVRELRQLLFDERGRLRDGNRLSIRPIRTRAGVGYAASMRLNDDVGDKGYGTTWTLVVDAAGRRIGRLDEVWVKLVVDVDGDGIDELLTDNALSFHDGRRWVRVRGWTGPAEC